MGLVVDGGAGAGAVEDVGGVVDVAAAAVGHAARHDVDAQPPGEGAEEGAGPGTGSLGEDVEVLPGEKARVEGLGQDDGVGMLRGHGLLDQGRGAGEIVLRRAEAHLHLNAGDPHGGSFLTRNAVPRAGRPAGGTAIPR